MLLEWSVALLWLIVIVLIILFTLSYFNGSLPSKTLITYSNTPAYTPGYFLYYGAQLPEFNRAALVMPGHGVISDLYISLILPNSGDMSFTIHKNNVLTSLSVVVPQGSSTAFNSSDFITFQAGDLIALQYNGNVTNNIGRTTFSISTL